MTDIRIPLKVWLTLLATPDKRITATTKALVTAIAAARGNLEMRGIAREGWVTTQEIGEFLGTSTQGSGQDVMRRHLHLLVKMGILEKAKTKQVWYWRWRDEDDE